MTGGFIELLTEFRDSVGFSVITELSRQKLMNLCTARAACSMLDCTMDQLQELVERRILRTLKLGNQVRYFTEESFQGAYCVVGEEL